MAQENSLQTYLHLHPHKRSHSNQHIRQPRKRSNQVANLLSRQTPNQGKVKT